MESYKNLKIERRKRVVEILAKGLSRVVDNWNKSSDISKLRENKYSQFVDYKVDIPRDKSVCVNHESNGN